MSETLTHLLDRSLSSGDPIVIDGALGTALESRGIDLDHELWSAGLLRDDPEAIAEVHRDYIRAGARIITTASYQATPLGFASLGLSPDEGRTLIARSVEVARAARADTDSATHSRTRAAADAGANPGAAEVLVAGSVGPYGAALGDGAEYTGDYSLTPAEFAEFHRPRIAALVDAGADLLAIETQPHLTEIEALCTLADEHSAPAWLSVTLADGEHLADGSPLTALAEVVSAHESIRAVGVNCVSPSLVAPALRALAGATALPLIAYPNSGEVYDARTMEWRTPEDSGRSPVHLGEEAPDDPGTGAGGGAGGDVAESADGAAADPGGGTTTFPIEDWARLGALLIGGCCRTGPADIAGIARRLTA
ncbi:homocysteine S-methyltransferase [Brevibacterium sanguinis]|uniref:Homocysteine S-methyltransferase n=2 Tax=Brevibacterium TaxID=1696 RepID=A0A366IEX2_9MICO|nr:MULTISPECIES: homocysteine S-methyltransferase [Brevibacterium]RBP63466.1 homocysteine S-methyltransferase [Brevibacterium sanguinis]RBP69933.1 homocysteine S-methyltransferase [Brevibacterium celere]